MSDVPLLTWYAFLIRLFACFGSRYKALGMTESGKKWKLFFKVFCYLEPEKVPDETVESGFLYEQVTKEQ